LSLIRQYDNELLLWVQALRRPVMDRFFLGLTEMGNIYFAAGLALILFLLLKGQRKFIVLELLLASFATYCMVGFLKNWFQIPRPFDSLDLVPAVLSGGFAFPSGHAAIAFTLATTMCVRFKRFCIPIACCAVLVGISRIYLGVHYATDVLAGALLGVGMSFSVRKIFSWRKINIETSLSID